MKSPCTNLCRYTKLNDIAICEGCGRTSEDLSNWISYNKEEKRDCIKRCKANLKKLGKN